MPKAIAVGIAIIAMLGPPQLPLPESANAPVRVTTAAISPCDDPDASGACLRPGESVSVILWGYNAAGTCTIQYRIDWGDGSPPEDHTSTPGTAEYVDHAYNTLGNFTVRAATTVVAGVPSCAQSDWNETIPVEVAPPPQWGVVKLHDIDGSNLAFLSTDNHDYFGGFTRLHGTLTINGVGLDSVTYVNLEIENGKASVTARLSASAQQKLLNKPFGSDRKIQLSSTRLFLLAAKRAAFFDTTSNDETDITLTVAVNNGYLLKKTFPSIPVLVRYKGPNRYGPRDASVGGDDWVRPTVRTVVEKYPGIAWGDFSNMNGGSFDPPHGSHRVGVDIDGHFPGYNPRTSATAATIISHLNMPTWGSRIKRVFVTYNRPGGPVFAGRPTPDPFWLAIKNVTLADGRTAKSVVKPEPAHADHFHWRVEK